MVNRSAAALRHQSNFHKTRDGSFKRDNVTLQPGQTLQLQIRLEQGVTLGTAGDDPATEAAFLRKRAVVPRRAVPRLSDGDRKSVV